MSSTLFVSDLHLSPTRPAIAERFQAFLANEARHAQALYILGDLFDYWAGDDDIGAPFNATLCDGLSSLAKAGTGVYLQVGNRDFLIGKDFAAAAGATLLEEHALVDVEGTPTLLLHGDTLCTSDVEYQRFRSEVRNSNWRSDFLSLPLAERKAQIEALRRRSEAAKEGKTMALMDVDAMAVTELFRQFATPPRMIHGHTHRPACHHLFCDGQPCERWVLAAWDDQPSYLHVDRAGCRAIALD